MPAVFLAKTLPLNEALPLRISKDSLIPVPWTKYILSQKPIFPSLLP